MLRSLLSKRSLLAASAGFLLAGCPDPEGTFDEFVDRRPVKDASVVQEPDAAGAFDISGEYMLGIATFLLPTEPMLFRASARWEPAATPTEELAGNLFLVLQPLAQSTPSRPDDARQPVGEAYQEIQIPVDGAGRFVIEMGERTVQGAANPITGRDIVATISLHGSMRSQTEFCGRVTGMVTQPLIADLESGNSTWGVVRVGDYGTQVSYRGVEKVAACSAASEPDAGPPPGDAGPPPGDAGPPPGDAGPDPADGGPGPGPEPAPAEGRCVPGFAGEMQVLFITDTQRSQGESAREFLVRLEEHPTACYIGRAISPTTGGDLGDVRTASEVDGALKFTVEGFVIPPGANPLLPNGGKANITFRGTSHVPGRGACGKIEFALYEPFALTSAGDFAAGIGLRPTEPACAGFPAQGCGLEGLAGEHTLQFVTTGAPTVVGLHLEANNLTCVQGWIESRQQPGTKIADVRRTAPAQDDAALVMEVRNFQIPPGANPLLPDGGAADMELVATRLFGSDGACGDITVNLYEPMTLAAEGTFAFGRVGTAEPAGPICP